MIGLLRSQTTPHRRIPNNRREPKPIDQQRCELLGGDRGLTRRLSLPRVTFAKLFTEIWIQDRDKVEPAICRYI